MSSAWIQHCKAYQQQHGCSYKDAMKHARETYNPSEMSGGSMKSLIKKGKKMAVKEAKKQHLGAKAKKLAVKYGNELVDDAIDGVIATNPEIGIPLAVGKKALEKKVLGGGKNPYLGGSYKPHGGSFKTHTPSHNMSGGCSSCKLSSTESSMLNPQHPAFNPVKKKSYRKTKYEN